MSKIYKKRTVSVHWGLVIPQRFVWVNTLTLSPLRIWIHHNKYIRKDNAAYKYNFPDTASHWKIQGCCCFHVIVKHITSFSEQVREMTWGFASNVKDIAMTKHIGEGSHFSLCRSLSLKPQAGSLLFAAVLLLLQPIQTEVVDPVFQIGGLMSNDTLPQLQGHSVSWTSPLSYCYKSQIRHEGLVNWTVIMVITNGHFKLPTGASEGMYGLMYTFIIPEGTNPTQNKAQILSAEAKKLHVDFTGKI